MHCRHGSGTKPASAFKRHEVREGQAGTRPGSHGEVSERAAPNQRSLPPVVAADDVAGLAGVEIEGSEGLAGGGADGQVRFVAGDAQELGKLIGAEEAASVFRSPRYDLA